MSEDQDVLICEIPREDGEKVCLMLREFRGKKYFDLRLWYIPEDKTEYFPTRKGLCLNLEHLPGIRRGLDQIGEITLQAGPGSPPDSRVPKRQAPAVQTGIAI